MFGTRLAQMKAARVCGGRGLCWPHRFTPEGVPASGLREGSAELGIGECDGAHIQQHRRSARSQSDRASEKQRARHGSEAGCLPGCFAPWNWPADCTPRAAGSWRRRRLRPAWLPERSCRFAPRIHTRTRSRSRPHSRWPPSSRCWTASPPIVPPARSCPRSRPVAQPDTSSCERNLATFFLLSPAGPYTSAATEMVSVIFQD